MNICVDQSFAGILCFLSDLDPKWKSSMQTIWSSCKLLQFIYRVFQHIKINPGLSGLSGTSDTVTVANPLAAEYWQCLQPFGHFLCQYLQYFQSYLEIFIIHIAAAVPLLETDNIYISPVCRYIIERWPVLMACAWKNCVLLAAFLDKISIFHLGQTESTSLGAFSSKPSRNILCSMIINIISTSCAYVLPVMSQLIFALHWTLRLDDKCTNLWRFFLLKYCSSVKAQ